MKTWLTTAAAICALSSVQGVDINQKGDPLTLTQPLSLTDGGDAHDAVAIKSGGRITNQSRTNPLRFGVAAGDVGSLSVETGGALYMSAGVSCGIYFGGTLASPAFSCKGHFWDSLFPYYTFITADAVVDGEEINFMRLASEDGRLDDTSSASVMQIQNDNRKPAVITFAGMGLMRVTGYTAGLSVPEETSKFILRSDMGNPILFLNTANWSQRDSLWQFPYNDSDAGIIDFDNGTAPVIFGPRGGSTTREDRNTLFGSVSFRRAYDSGRLNWLGTGPVCFTNTFVKLNADNTLPYRADAVVPLHFGVTSSTVVEEGHRTCLDVNGKCAKVGSLQMGNGTYVTNTATTSGSLVFGADGLASSLSGTVDDSVTIIKAPGPGTLTVGDCHASSWASGVTPIPTERVSEYKESTRGVPVGSCWPTLLRDMSLTETQVVDVKGTLDFAVTEGAEKFVESLTLTGSGTLRKTGTGTVSLAGSQSLPSRLEVTAGRLSVSGAGNADKYYRISFDFAWRSNNNTAGLGKIGLFDAAGNWVAKGLDFAGEDIAASQLPSGTFTLPAALKYSKTSNYSDSPKSLFSDDFSKYGMNVTNLVSYRETMSSAVVTVTLHLPEEANPVRWFSTYRQTNQPPKMQTVESSPDGVHWRVVSGFDELEFRGGDYYAWANDRSFGSGQVGSATLYAGKPFEVVPSGDVVTDMEAAITAKVDAGATLDLSAAANVTVSKVELDLSKGAGSLVGGSLSSAGAVEIVGENPVPNCVVANLLDVAEAANIKKWPVTVNGNPSNWRVSYQPATGKATLQAPGLLVVFR